MEGTRPNAYNYDYGGHPAPAGPALPNLINAVRMLKSKSKSKSKDNTFCVGVTLAVAPTIQIRPVGATVPGRLVLILTLTF